MIEFIQTIKNRIKLPQSWVDISNHGFTKNVKRGIFRPQEQFIEWEEVTEIIAYMADCFTMHVLGLQFTRCDGTHVNVDDSDEGWQDLLVAVRNKFQDFNNDNLATVEGYFPKEGSLICWQKKELANQPNERTG